MFNFVDMKSIKIEREISIDDFYNVCRICMRNGVDLYSIFRHNSNGIIEDLSNKMKLCSDINIYENDGLPANICVDCLELLNKAHLFKTLSVQTDLRLRSIHSIFSSELDRKKTKYPQIDRKFEISPDISQESDDSLLKPIIDNIKTDVAEESVLPYTCSVCSKTFLEREQYDNHLLMHNKKAEILKSKTKKSLKHKILSRFKRFQCDICSRKFKSKFYMIRHLNIHGPPKTYICEFCGRKFNKRANMIAHFASHSTDKKYECAECNFKTAYKNSLIIHIRKHSGDRPFTCDICGYASNSGSNLYTHRRQHTGEKYNCKLCSKTFGYIASLNEHVVATHKGLKIHSCNQCDKTYSRRRGLRRHIQTKHPNSDDMPNQSEIENET